MISPILNRQFATVWKILIFFVTTFLLSENAATSGGRLANLKKSQINHPYYTQIILILNFFCNVFLT